MVQMSCKCSDSVWYKHSTVEKHSSHIAKLYLHKVSHLSWQMRILQRPAPVQPQPIPQPESTPDVGPYSKTELKKLKDLLLQRDNEINILII